MTDAPGTNLGGLAGTAGPDGTSSVSIHNAYANVSIASPAGPSTNTGGFFGDNGSVTLSQSFWNSDLVANGSDHALSGATGVTTSQLEQSATFIGWDLGALWEIQEGVSAPQLR